MISDYYSILGLPFDATPDEIRSAYFDAARRLHPDVNPDPSSSELFIQVQEAYQVLSNPRTRADLDAQLAASFIPNPAVALNIQPSRPAVTHLAEPQLLYLYLDLICTSDPGKQAPPPVNLCLVVDCSTSMQGERIDMVKANLAQIFRSLKRNDTLTLITFSDRAEVLIPPITGQSLNGKNERIFQLQTGGGTEIYQGLKAGVDQVRLSSQPGAVQQLILITDGRTYGDEQACLSLARQARQEGIAISTVGIGHEWNDILLDQIATMSGGSTGFISTPRDLSRFLDEKMDSFTRLYASSLELSLRSNPLVELRYAFRLNSGVVPLDLSLPVTLGSLQYQKSVAVLLEFYIHKLPANVDFVHLLSGWLHLNLVGQGSSKARLPLDVKLPVRQEMQSDRPPSIILEALLRITLYRLQEKARAEASAGDFSAATRYLQNLATHLLSHGDQELARTVLIETEHLRQSQIFSKDGDKRIKYGTRMLLLPPGNGGLR